MSKKHEVSLHFYLSRLPAYQKKEAAGLIKKSLPYIYQSIHGINFPDEIKRQLLIDYSMENKVRHCYLTEQSILAGYLEIKAKKKEKEDKK